MPIIDSSSIISAHAATISHRSRTDFPRDHNSKRASHSSARSFLGCHIQKAKPYRHTSKLRQKSMLLRSRPRSAHMTTTMMIATLQIIAVRGEARSHLSCACQNEEGIAQQARESQIAKKYSGQAAL